MKNILVTGAAGFIGFHLTEKLLKNKSLNVFGIDNIDDYYDVKLKKSRLKILKKNKRFFFYKLDISNQNKIEPIFKKFKFYKVINLAAQAGVRFSISNPDSYFKSNVLGFYNILKLCVRYKIQHLIYASTSSVYGDTNKIPFKESDDTSKPIQFYAATKKSNEVMAYSFSSIYKLPTTGLRFFTVYGPWGRPDMALFKFTENILNDKSIPIFNFGKHNRDFTFVDDIVSGILKIFNSVPKKKNGISAEVFNIGRGKKEKLLDYIGIIKKTLNKSYKAQFLKKQKGDIHETQGDISKIKKEFKYSPKTNINVGIPKFINWYKKFYKKIDEK
jgi:UDP-glucuronate 4-epimerase